MARGPTDFWGQASRPVLFGKLHKPPAATEHARSEHPGPHHERDASAGLLRAHRLRDAIAAKLRATKLLAIAADPDAIASRTLKALSRLAPAQRDRVVEHILRADPELKPVVRAYVTVLRLRMP